MANTLCAVGFIRPAGGTTCSPCPTGSTFSAQLNLCQTPPLVGNQCSPGTTAFTGGGISIIYCADPLLPLDATRANQASLTFNPGSPHAYLIEIAGYTGSFSIDGVPIAAVPLYSTFHLPTGDVFCDTGKTDSSGTARCVEALAPLPAGQLVPVDATFVFNCGEFTLRTGFTPLGVGHSGAGERYPVCDRTIGGARRYLCGSHRLRRSVGQGLLRITH